MNRSKRTFPFVHNCRLHWLCSICLYLSLSLSLIKGLRENQQKKKRSFPKRSEKSWRHFQTYIHTQLDHFPRLHVKSAYYDNYLCVKKIKKRLLELCFIVTLKYFFYPLNCFPSLHNTMARISCYYFPLGTVTLQEASQWIATFWKHHLAFNIPGTCLHSMHNGKSIHRWHLLRTYYMSGIVLSTW